jgi:hypothetical protein
METGNGFYGAGSAARYLPDARSRPGARNAEVLARRKTSGQGIEKTEKILSTTLYVVPACVYLVKTGGTTLLQACFRGKTPEPAKRRELCTGKNGIF